MEPYLGAVVLFSSLITLASSHPQCLDFKPPFRAEDGLDFCSQYQNFTCCSRANDTAVQQRYQYILRQVDQGTARRCQQYLKAILCLDCDPYAAHVFSFEETTQKKPFPGLCGAYCVKFYLQCKILIPFISDDPRVVSASEDGHQRFCEFTKVVDKEDCYPDLSTNSRDI